MYLMGVTFRRHGHERNPEMGTRPLSLTMVVVLAAWLSVWGAVAPATPPGRAGTSERPQGQAIEDESIRIAGVVQDANGKPLAGADVWLRQWTKGRHYRKPSRTRLTRLATGKNGTFEFRSQPPAGEYTTLAVVAWKEGFCCHGECLVQETTDYGRKCRSRHLTLRLGPPGELAGHAVDESGKEIEGVRVVARIGREYGTDMPFLTARTDPNGRFVFHNLPRGSAVELVLTGAGYASDYRWHFVPGQKDVRISLRKECRIVGQVVERGTRKPVAGVPLRIRLSHEEALGEPLVVSDKDGRFLFDGLPEGRYVPWICDIDRTTLRWWARSQVVNLKPGQEQSGVIVEVFPSERLVISLKDKATGMGVPGVRFHIGNGKGGHIWLATDANGIADIPVQSGKYGIYAWKFGYKTPSATGQWSMMFPEMDDYLARVEVKAGQTARLNDFMIPLPAAHGVVRGPDGKPMRDVQVSQMPNYGYGRDVDTDAAGRFKVSLAPPDVGPDDHVYAVTCDKMLAAIVPVGDAKSNLDVRLAPVAIVRIAARDLAGQPVPSAYIDCSTTLGKELAGVDMDLLCTDDQGIAAVKGLPAGRRYTLSLKAKGFKRKEVEVDIPAVAAGKTLVLKHIVLEAAKSETR